MSENQSTPAPLLNAVCTHCGYDISGTIPNRDGQVTCPECGSEIKKHLITGPVSRWDRLAFCCMLILFIPALVFFTFVILGIVPGLRWISVLSLPGYLITTAGLLIWFSRFEADKRFWWSNPSPKFTPPLWVFITLMIMFVIACIVGEYLIFVLWMFSQI